MTPLLLTPGPLTTSEATRRALLDDHGSRDPAFVARFPGRAGAPRRAPGHHGAFTCVPMQGSGTFAVEAMIGTLTPPGGGVLVCVNGAYGARAAEIAERAGRAVTRLTFAETEPVSPARLAAALAADPSLQHVVLIHSETTTGLVNPVEAVADVVLAAGRRLLIDAMSSFGALPLSWPRADRRRRLLGEQVPGGCPRPRLCAHPRSRRLAPCAGRCHSVSLDLHAQWRRLEQDGQLRFTPPTQVIAALDVALAPTRRGGRRRRSRRALRREPRPADPGPYAAWACAPCCPRPTKARSSSPCVPRAPRLPLWAPLRRPRRAGLPHLPRQAHRRGHLPRGLHRPGLPRRHPAVSRAP
jgi:2-aminoethylphosphonate-pyruvate transaminase